MLLAPSPPTVGLSVPSNTVAGVAVNNPSEPATPRVAVVGLALPPGNCTVLPAAPPPRPPSPDTIGVPGLSGL